MVGEEEKKEKREETKGKKKEKREAKMAKISPGSERRKTSRRRINKRITGMGGGKIYVPPMSPTCASYSSCHHRHYLVIQ